MGVYKYEYMHMPSYVNAYMSIYYLCGGIWCLLQWKRSGADD